MNRILKFISINFIGLAVFLFYCTPSYNNRSNTLKIQSSSPNVACSYITIDENISIGKYSWFYFLFFSWTDKYKRPKLRAKADSIFCNNLREKFEVIQSDSLKALLIDIRKYQNNIDSVMMCLLRNNIKILLIPHISAIDNGILQVNVYHYDGNITTIHTIKHMLYLNECSNKTEDFHKILQCFEIQLSSATNKLMLKLVDIEK